RSRGREIVQIYRGDIPITRPKTGRSGNRTGYNGPQNSSTFNILYANTEVMLPAAYSKPPDPVVRSRFVKKSAVPQPPPPPPIIPGGFGLPPQSPGMGAGPPGAPPPPMGPQGPGAAPVPPGGPMPPQGPPPPGGQSPLPPPPGVGPPPPPPMPEG